jgi:hypothetical protein
MQKQSICTFATYACRDDCLVLKTSDVLAKSIQCLVRIIHVSKGSTSMPKAPSVSSHPVSVVGLLDTRSQSPGKVFAFRLFLMQPAFDTAAQF